VKRKSIKVNTKNRGTIFLEIDSIETPDILLATYKFTAIGGVIIPMDVFMIIISPRAIGSIPKCTQMGRTIGVISRIID
jgi:hypothetical protein